MYRVTKDKIIKEFELLTQYMNDDELLKINLHLLKLDECDDDVTKLEPSYQSLCLFLMELVVQKNKISKIKNSNGISLITDEEKYFLSSLYD
ncbi:MAG: hypothetical protein ACJA0H_001484 [Francisellaceae bacterium]|jgi:hypothetical protein